jgi:hypothetical protein
VRTADGGSAPPWMRIADAGGEAAYAHGERRCEWRLAACISLERHSKPCLCEKPGPPGIRSQGQGGTGPPWRRLAVAGGEPPPCSCAPPASATRLLALRLAASRRRHHQKDLVKALAWLRADVNAGNKRGATPGYVAAYTGHLEVVRALASFGANERAPNKAGMTSASMAAYQGHLDAVNGRLLPAPT